MPTNKHGCQSDNQDDSGSVSVLAGPLGDRQHDNKYITLSLNIRLPFDKFNGCGSSILNIITSRSLVRS